MCGIVGYKGSRNAVEVVFKGIKDLEYRGYDSWGIASLSNLDNEIEVVKEVGKIGSVLLENIMLKPSKVAIAHTRWATTGEASKVNAHPHISQSKSFALVHNGIVENFQELRKELETKGYKFYSQTDTEVIVKLVEEELKNHSDLKDAVRSAFQKLKGRNAFVLVEKESKRLIAVCRGSPLMIGLGQDEFFLASDPSPLLNYTKRVIFLDDDELTVIGNDFRIFDVKTGVELKKQVGILNWNPEQAKKGKYPHFMLKEILEQRHTIKQALVQDPELIQKIAKEINNAFGVYAVGCGTAGKVCLAGTYAFAKIAKKHINFAFGSEFPYFSPFIVDRSLLIAVSQSGETADTLEAMKTVSDRNGKIVSLVNVMGCSVMRKSEFSLLLNNGPEIAVASTKATTSQLALMILLAYACAGRFEDGLTLLSKVSEEVDKMLDNAFLKNLKFLAEKIKSASDVYIIGRGVNYAMALEAAIKIQEVSYIHAEGFAGGELKHGPIALIDEGTPCIVLVANDETKADVLSNAFEVKTRKGFVIGISPENNEVFDFWVKVPDVGVASAIVNIIPVQLLAYYLAVAKNLDPDKPRNLAKSVTVK
ncbi:glutamine--fructose-6-phosphate transaminase (isomerizing) [Candidatus Woesearchaeota archaeon]|nr:MAG: glutamine--fructose-6-phosphate transaminase (isomerizing) [Candidatus Woesearchaeota archaeon ex4484_78]RLE46428.1 MAG: glutamine--fructose-6-phosphate transaminase (isomerizing) [Candidatus Woesearchaeota archaeon]